MKAPLVTVTAPLPSMLHAKMRSAKAAAGLVVHLTTMEGWICVCGNWVLGKHHTNKFPAAELPTTYVIESAAFPALKRRSARRSWHPSSTSQLRLLFLRSVTISQTYPVSDAPSTQASRRPSVHTRSAGGCANIPSSCPRGRGSSPSTAHNLILCWPAVTNLEQSGSKANAPTLTLSAWKVLSRAPLVRLTSATSALPADTKAACLNSCTTIPVMPVDMGFVESSLSAPAMDHTCRPPVIVPSSTVPPSAARFAPPSCRLPPKPMAEKISDCSVCENRSPLELTEKTLNSLPKATTKFSTAGSKSQRNVDAMTAPGGGKAVHSKTFP
mmetsp:Transcript_11283/g.24971  ORF Transcript_11283/g.24971 Transcript_11283/m.24971 type:complete len:327 (+) Transcript_11283:1045-2025(+)